jgi:hypothetical protein
MKFLLTSFFAVVAMSAMASNQVTAPSMAQNQVSKAALAEAAEKLFECTASYTANAGGPGGTSVTRTATAATCAGAEALAFYAAEGALNEMLE